MAAASARWPAESRPERGSSSSAQPKAAAAGRASAVGRAAASAALTGEVPVPLASVSRSIKSAFLPLTLRPRSFSAALSSTTVMDDHAAEHSGCPRAHCGPAAGEHSLGIVKPDADRGARPRNETAARRRMENPRLPARSHRICPQEPDGPPPRRSAAPLARSTAAEDGGGNEADALKLSTRDPFNKARI